MARVITREDFDEEAELDKLAREIEALTPEELDQRLRDDGFDPELEKERAREMFFEALFDMHSKLTPPGNS